MICSMSWVGVEVSPFLLGYVIGRQLATVVCLAVCGCNPLHFHQDLILAASIRKGVGSLSCVKSICYEVVILVLLNASRSPISCAGICGVCVKQSVGLEYQAF